MKNLIFLVCLFLAESLFGQKEIWPIKIDPIEETQPRSRFFATAQETNWGRTVCAPDEVVAKAISLAKYKVHVHIMDTGEPNHVLLQTGKVPGVNMTNDPMADGNSHGTHCAGIIASKDFGVAQALVDKGLLTWQSDKVLTNNGVGTFSWIYQAIDANYAADVARANGGTAIVYSASLGGDVAPIATVETALKKVVDLGGYVVFASGNSGTEKVGYPASSPYSIAVSSLDENLSVSSFSSTGPQVSFSAPGRNIASTILDNKIGKKSGTSMACPNLAAMVAWAKAIWGPGIPNQDFMKKYLGWCAMDIPPAGKDNKSGWGLALLDAITQKNPKDLPPGWGQTPPPPPPPAPDPTRPGRTLTHTLTGSWTILWGLNAAAGSEEEPHFIKSVKSKSQYEKLEVTYIEFTAPTAYYWQKASKDAKSTIDWFFTNRGMLMGSPSDEHDVVRWLGRFVEMVPELDKKMSGIRVKVIAAKDSKGATIMLRENDLEHYPRK